MPTDIIVTAPLPPFLYDPLKAAYRCHDYVAATDKPGLLASAAAKIRGLVQGGGTVTPTSLLDALPALEIISAGSADSRSRIRPTCSPTTSPTSPWPSS